jgi:hypothetical protein
LDDALRGQTSRGGLSTMAFGAMFLLASEVWCELGGTSWKIRSSPEDQAAYRLSRGQAARRRQPSGAEVPDPDPPISKTTSSLFRCTVAVLLHNIAGIPSPRIRAHPLTRPPARSVYPSAVHLSTMGHLPPTTPAEPAVIAQPPPTAPSDWDLWSYVDPSPHARPPPYTLIILNQPIRDSVQFRNLWKRA